MSMANLMAPAIKAYDTMMSNADTRVADWFMMSTPWPSFAICFVYLIVIKKGPAYMESRKAFDLRQVMLVYNFCIILLSTYMFVEFLSAGWGTHYSLGCQPVDYSNSPKAIRMARACWLFYLSKFIELLDTLFFVLRKKYNQVSFLHVFHHTVMPFSWWFGVKFVAGGFGTFHAVCNSGIHMVMYSYYFLAALGPGVQKYLWWKRYLTTLQIIQFISVVLHSSQLLFRECNYPTLFVYWIAFYGVSFLLLFADFYRKTYTNIPKVHKGENGSAVKNGFKGKNGIKGRNGIKAKNGVKKDS